MGLFTLNVKKIKGGAHKNGDIDGTCKGIVTQKAAIQ